MIGGDGVVMIDELLPSGVKLPAAPLPAVPVWPSRALRFAAAAYALLRLLL